LNELYRKSVFLRSSTAALVAFLLIAFWQPKIVIFRFGFVVRTAEVRLILIKFNGTGFVRVGLFHILENLSFHSVLHQIL